MTDYELVIHLRENLEPERIALPGVSEEDAEAERRTLLYDLEHAKLSEVPVFAIQTKSGFPPEPLAVDPQAVTEIDLVESAPAEG